MSLEPFFKWLEATALSTSIREGVSLFPFVESIHVVAFAVVLGTIATVDLRLLGLVRVNQRFSDVSRTFLPITWTAFAVAAVAGSMLFASNPIVYAHNFYFEFKLSLLLLAGINAVVFHTLGARHLAEWDANLRTPWPARIAGACSLLFWTSIVVCGRWIGFTME